MTSVIARGIPCPKCGVKAGQTCINRDGSPSSRSHINRTPNQPCGSNAGYIRHVKAAETPCDPCREARRRYMSEYRTRRPDVRDRDIAGLMARRAATKALIERHRDEFAELLKEMAS